MKETPQEWGSRNVEQLAGSTKERLGSDMVFVIRLNLACTFLFAIGVFVGIAFREWWAFGAACATFVLFGVSLYWAWYIRRGLNRRWEKEMAARVFAEKRADAAFSAPDDRLLNRTRGVGDAIPGQISGPMRSWGSDTD